MKSFRGVIPRTWPKPHIKRVFVTDTILGLFHSNAWGCDGNIGMTPAEAYATWLTSGSKPYATCVSRPIPGYISFDPANQPFHNLRS